MSDTDETERKRPNILVTGTPGTGKTVTASLIAVHMTFLRFIFVISDFMTSHHSTT